MSTMQKYAIKREIAILGGLKEKLIIDSPFGITIALKLPNARIISVSLPFIVAFQYGW